MLTDDIKVFKAIIRSSERNKSFLRHLILTTLCKLMQCNLERVKETVLSH